MKKLGLIALVITALASCHSKSSNNPNDGTDFIDSLATIISNTIADNSVYTYEGILPAADAQGIRYTLTLTSEEGAYVGSYDLKLTYLKEGGDQDKTFEEQGQFVAKKGLENDKDAKVYHLVPDSGDNDIYLWLKNDSTLTLLDQDMNKIDSQFNYDLILVKR